MQAVVIFGVLALLSTSLAIPVIQRLKDESAYDVLGEDNIIGDRIEENPKQAQEKENEDDERIWKFLKFYGYMPDEDEKKSHGDKLMRKALWKFAVWNGAKIGKKLFMSKATPIFLRYLTRISKQARCGVPDIGQGRLQAKKKINSKTEKRYLAVTPWGKNTLTYKVESFDNDLPVEVQQQEIAKAFKLWSDVSELTITEVQGSANADINIQFVAGAHSDSMPFDGPGLVVAHAFYPEDGRIHFDSDEQYTTGGETNKKNLLSIATHEIGHALGLGHSTHSDAVMYAQYQPYSPDFALTQDDINGIQYLYPSNTAECVDEFWCEDILENECHLFPGYCKNKCGTCQTT